MREVSLGPNKIEYKKFISFDEFKDRVEKKGEKLVILDDSFSQWIEILEVLSKSKSIQLSCLSELVKDVFNAIGDLPFLSSALLHCVLDDCHVSEVVGLGVLQKL